MKGYFKPESSISYKSEVIEINYAAKTLSMDWVDSHAYMRSKISYIPSERNMVILPEMEKVQFEDNSIRNFLFDWFTARKNYSHEKQLSVSNLNINYYFSEKNGTNNIVGTEENDSYQILLPDASSGLQSIIPLIAVIDYLTHSIYNRKEAISFVQQEKIERASSALTLDLICNPQFEGRIELNTLKDLSDLSASGDIDEVSANLLQDVNRIRQNLFTTQNSQFIIEEPEQNLFPMAQRDLIYYLLEKCLDEKRNHRMTITTHSPYILYALNNCMLGKLVADRLSDDEWKAVKCRSSLIDPKEVSIYQIKNGELYSIQQEDGLIGENYFDANMKEIMDDYYTFLNHYDDEK
jgi:hypothetical protein